MRPAFHFTAASGWINDPHGVTYHDGRYHAFFQYVPGSADWAPECRWGHAAGVDLLSLGELPVAIAPGDGDDGIWTGALVEKAHGAARAFYTTVTGPDLGIGRVRVADADDPAWVSWTKGPVVVDAPAGHDLVAFRDPFLRRDTDAWRMFVGAGDVSGTALLLAYRSADLEEWEYEGVALARATTERAGAWTGSMWECPQVFEVDGRDVMVCSVWDDGVLYGVAYAVGTASGAAFAASAWGLLTYGDSHYAASFFRDAVGRPCVTFWMRGIADADAGWAGAHSIPYVLSLRDDLLVATPHPDLDRYHAPASSSGVVAGLAADISWTPDADGLTITSGGAVVARLVLVGDEVDIVAGGASGRLPHPGPVRVVVDGPTLEVSGAAGVFGAAVEPHGDSLTVSAAGDATVHALMRHGVE